MSDSTEHANLLCSACLIDGEFCGRTNGVQHPDQAHDTQDRAVNAPGSEHTHVILTSKTSLIADSQAGLLIQLREIATPAVTIATLHAQLASLAQDKRKIQQDLEDERKISGSS